MISTIQRGSWFSFDFSCASLINKLKNLQKQAVIASPNSEINKRIQILKTEKYLVILDTIKIIAGAISDCSFTKQNMDYVARILQELFMIDEFYYATIKKDKLKKVVAYTHPRIGLLYEPILEIINTEIPEFWDTLQMKKCYCVENNNFSPEDLDYYKKINVVNVYACPVIVNNVVRGVVGFNKLQTEKWTDEERSICKIFASLTATSLWIRDTKQCQQKE